MTPRDRLNELQRARRARLNRLDYAAVSPEAKSIIDSLREEGSDGAASAILNRIVTEWAELTDFRSND